MKKALFLAVIALAAMTLMAGTAFAEGYNDGGWNFTTGADESGYGDNAGIYVRDPLGADQELSAQGPHGGYAVSTNKCQDCHSTHYALGSFVLMRSDSREDACTFCHQGGGGSTVNIMMDNEYDANGVVTTSTTGFGTGHTLGYKGSAPADIKPAFTEQDGLACFSCHTPHGNSARVVATPANPGAAIDIFKDMLGVTAPYNGVVREVRLNHGGRDTANEAAFLITEGPMTGYYDLNKVNQADFNTICVSAVSPAQKTARWGISPYAENMVFRRGAMNPLTGGITDTHAITRPIFKQGKWLLIQNPNVKTTEETITVYSWEKTGSGPAWTPSPAVVTVLPNGMTLSPGAPPTRPLRGKVVTLYPGDEVPNTAIGFRFWTGTDPAAVGGYTTDTYAAGGVATGVDAAAWAGFARPLTPKGLMNTTAAPKRDMDRVYLKGAFTEAEVEALAADDSRWVGEADGGLNKYAMDWKDALGPADQMSLDEQESDRNQAYPFTASPMHTGFGSVNEMCVDCHAGAGGASTQKANVFMPDYNGGGSYQLAYSHDAQPRH